MSQPSEKFDCYCIVELFGHAKIAGRCTEQNIAGANMLRVDVPETDGQPAFTRFFESAAIYAINPVDETTCKHIAGQLQIKPIEAWNVSDVLKKYQQQLALKNAIPGEEQPIEIEDNGNEDYRDDGEDNNDW
jgi:hypothetical protein